MSVPEKLKLFLDCSDYFNADENYGTILHQAIVELPGYPKVEIDADPMEDIRFVTTENYNEEKFELLDTENFTIVSANEDEIIVCSGSDKHGPMTMTVKSSDKTGKLHITDIYIGFNDGMPFDEFDDMIRNV